MRYKRGKIWALTLLCVSLAMLLSGMSVLIGFGNFFVRGSESNTNNVNTIPEFDDLYKRIPFGEADTGEVVLGHSNGIVTSLSLRDESYGGGNIYNLLNNSVEGGLGFSTLKNYRTRNPYPLFSNGDMRNIIGGATVDAPVIMLGGGNVDNAVIFELLNLTNPPTKISMKHNGQNLPQVILPPNTNSDFVYGGIKVESVPGSGIFTYKPGAVAYNELGATTIRGMFVEEGFYEFNFEIMVMGTDAMPKPVNFAFSFYIVSKMNYTNTLSNFPRFPIENRAVGLGEVYNYSYGGGYPEVTYNPDYFDVKIDSVQTYTGADEVNPGRFQFYNMGEYKMTSSLMYYYSDGVNAKWLRLTRYTPYTSTLYILGYQAYYGGWHEDPKYRGPLPFYDSNDSSSDSNISSWVESNENSQYLPIVSNRPSVSDTISYAQALAEMLDSQPDNADKLSPVKTNFPPVVFIGNVDYATGLSPSGEDAILATMSFHGVDDFAGSTKLWTHSTLRVGKPFSEAGEYLVTIYFRVNGNLCRQIFYFQISNSIDIKFNTGSEILTLNELVRNKLYVNQNVTVMYDGQTDLGKYEVPPTLKLERANLGSNDYRQVPFGNGGNFNFTLTEGHYRLTVTYGAYGQAVSIAEVVVDHQTAGTITPVSNAKKLANIPASANAAVYGNGKVALRWGEKLSGVGYKKATVEFYKTDISDLVADPNSDRNYDLYQKGQKNLFSSFNLTPTITSTNVYTPVKKEDGWMLDNTFTESGSGLYKITIEDDIGNQSLYILIIDNSKTSFTQNITSPSLSVNITDFPKPNGDKVQIGFGGNKLVATTVSTLFDGPEFAPLKSLPRPVIVKETRNGLLVDSISIPLASVEISKDGGVYSNISTTEFNNGYVELNSEGTYYFRATDMLGNISEYYIILTHDNSRGMLLAESTSKEIVDISRGFVIDKPSANTSLVTASGGMTNRNNVIFSFEQMDMNVRYRVQKIQMEYYALNFDKTSPNYPFASTSTYYLTHQYGNKEIYYDNPTNPNRDPKGLYNIALYNKGEQTRRGLYKITRIYETGSTTQDPTVRNYWFIVDDTGMLDYNPEKYRTDLEIKFGSKNAAAEQFDQKKNTLSSNLPADILGFNSKYKTTSFLGFQFSSLIPRFSVINNGITTNLGEGAIRKRIGDISTGDINYKLVVADNSRNFSIALGTGSVKEIITEGKLTSANYGVMNLLLDTGYGSKATITKNESTISSFDMEFQNGSYTYVIDSNGLFDLKFQFENDPSGFYADIDVNATSSSWVAVGLPNPVDIKGETVPPLPGFTNTTYVYDILNSYLIYNTIENGDMLSVTVKTIEGNSTVYNILFDNKNPSFNLNRVRAQDNLANGVIGDMPVDYIYGLSNEFKFEKVTSENQYLDTKEISYREIFASGEGESAAVSFRLDSGRTFASIVGLRYNELKYYQITERDYAGHIISYTVQLKGEGYNNDISFVGAVSPVGDNTIVGIEMQVRSSSVDQFWIDNRSFKFVCGDDYYSVLGGNSSWRIEGVSGSAPKNKSFLISTINNWINKYADKGEKIVFSLFDRIGSVEVFEFYNIRENDAKVELETYTTGGSSVFLDTTNYSKLPTILKDPALADKFKFEVLDTTDPNDIKVIANAKFSMPQTLLHTFGILHDKELIITVTDPFGRQTITEYHGQKKGGLSFIPYGNTVDLDGVTYVGDSRGVELQFMRSIYYVNVFDGKGNQVTNISSVTIGDITTYYFRPASQNDTSIYRIEAVGRLSGASLFDKTFAFDTRMPSISWTNASEQPITLGGTIVGTVNMQVIPNPTIKFGMSISYVRTSGNLVEKVTLKPGTETYQFDQVGKYIVTLRNSIWATSVYEFEIADVSNSLFKVYDDKIEVKPSDSLLKFYNEETGEYEYIKNYMFTNVGLVGDDYVANGLEVAASSSSNRVLVGKNGKNYHSINATQNALIWCMGIPSVNSIGETIYTSKIYFATTGITKNTISTSNPGISLVVNNVVLNRLQSHYEVHTDIGNKGMEVKLHPGTFADSEGAPYNQYAGNLLIIDCYRNGELVRSLSHKDKFYIGEFDSGAYEFRVRDLVGNTLEFGTIQSDRYTIINLSRPMIVINNENPINGLIYNDSVEFKSVNLADKLLSEKFGEEAFNKYFYISDFKVHRDNVELSEYTLVDVKNKYIENPYVWTTKGEYRIELKFKIGDHMDVKGQYSFQIIPSGVPLPRLSLPVYSDIEILSVRKNNYLVAGYTDLEAGSIIEFSADKNPGRYEIVFQTVDSVAGTKVHTINFNIANKEMVNTITINTTSGGSTSASVNISFKPTLLYIFQGDVTIELYKDETIKETVNINSEYIKNLGVNDEIKIEASEKGMYRVVAYDSEGDILYTDSWQIVQADNPIGAIITSIVAAIAVIGLIIFFRLRKKMTVK